jgi:choline dehydrogenase-like flavoprotein
VVSASWAVMNDLEYDVLVIGSGFSGSAAALLRPDGFRRCALLACGAMISRWVTAPNWSIGRITGLAAVPQHGWPLGCVTPARGGVG